MCSLLFWFICQCVQLFNFYAFILPHFSVALLASWRMSGWVWHAPYSVPCSCCLFIFVITINNIFLRFLLLDFVCEVVLVSSRSKLLYIVNNIIYWSVIETKMPDKQKLKLKRLFVNIIKLQARIWLSKRKQICCSCCLFICEMTFSYF